MKKIVTGLSLAMFILQGCYYDKEELLYPGSVVDCSSVSAKYTDVQPIINTKCATAGCHTTAAAAGGIALETYDQVRTMSVRINQRVIVERTMPPASPLPTNEIAILKCWINSGVPNN